MKSKNIHLVILLVCLFMSGCHCMGYLTVRGTVLDEAGAPISGVEVFLVFVDHSGADSKPSPPDAKTKDDGTYSVKYSYAYVSNSYAVFRKPGYQDVSTKSTPFGNLNACILENIIITRNAVMKP